MATQTLAQVRATVAAAHPGATTAAINATARKDYAVQAAKATGIATPTTANAPATAGAALAGLPQATAGPAPTLAQQGAPMGTTSDLAYYLTGTEQQALATGGSIDWVKESQSVAAAAPPGDTAAAGAYTGILYDRLRILANAYSNLYNPSGAIAGVAGNASLAQAIQLTQQQLYNYQNAQNTTPGTVPIPYNQFLQNEGVNVAGTPAVQKLLATAAPAGAPMATAAGVYAPNAGTAAYVAALGGGASSSPMTNPMVSSPITPSGPGTTYSAAVGGTGAAGGIPTVSGATAGGEGGTSVSGGGSDAGSSGGIAFPDLTSSTVAGFPLLDVLLIAGAGVGLWYVSKHRRKGKKG